MMASRIRILPLINNLKREIPDATQSWYADDVRTLGTFARLDTYFDSLTCQVPGRGYQPEPTNRVMIVCPDNIKDGKVFGRRHGFRMCTGARYLGDYIGDDGSKHDW